ncbi:GNAT family N-acetyltransferase [Actinotalea solisilvae]|uniref:GNAT family N-acetyltransferase n=1 Tax=Actinotalea solisilvae TaxID=2072922 RepID=UPI0018F20AB2|nr:GNAT family N-acetyltransferase [Actinotalea solisilvae]
MTTLDLRPARPDDAAALVALRDACARWQLARGVRQWVPGEVTLAVVAAQVAAGEWFVEDHEDHDDHEGRLVAAIRVLDEDPLVWPDRLPAGYLHGFMVDRELSGAGRGEAVLHWAEDEVRRRGHDVVRLDCVATNEVLRAYYAARGYAERGVADRTVAGLAPCLRFEKRLAAAPGDGPAADASP